jgi:hypothetical protein
MCDSILQVEDHCVGSGGYCFGEPSGRSPGTNSRLRALLAVGLTRLPCVGLEDCEAVGSWSHAITALKVQSSTAVSTDRVWWL